MPEARVPENPFDESYRRSRPPDPCIVVLFGATGDLTHRKLVPALYNLAREGHLSPRTAIVGFARREKTDESFRADMLEAVREQAGDGSLEDDLWERFAESLFYHQASFGEDEGYRSLGKRLEEIDRDLDTGGNRLFYLATSPDFFAPITRKLGAAGLAPRPGPGDSGGGSTPGDAPWIRVVVEKPFGRDLESARDLNCQLLEVLDESQIYRIDHYLGKETVQNILAFRFSNGIFEPLWNHNYVEQVQITVAENLGVGDRGPYYDAAGALRDMVQNHMMQLVSLVGMEPPISLDADAIRDEKVKVLRALRKLSPGEIRNNVVRARYTAGSILGESVRGYLEEDRVPGDSTTATYVALRVFLDNWRWAGVPFYLRHGKRLPKRATEIAIRFRKPPMPLFSEGTVGTVAPNTLVLNIQPDEGISLGFGSKVPGPDIRIGQVRMDFRYGRSFGGHTPDAYERLLLDAINGDSTLFTRRDEVEYAWAFISRILAVWEEDGSRGLREYSAGSWGPTEADELIGDPGDEWRRL